MKRSDVANVVWLCGAIAFIIWLGLRRADAKQAAAPSRQSSAAASATYAKLPDGERGVVDANGVVVPIKRYMRVAAATTVADGLLLALLEPERVVALTDYGKRHSATPHLYGERIVAVLGPKDLELLISEKVDLFVTNHLRSQAELARMREAGIAVFNLGDMRGLSTLLPSIGAFAALIGEPERGARFRDTFMRRMRAVAADIPLAQRKRAVYVSSYANQLFGGGKGTSYHDVLEHAGLIDVAAERFSGWVHYDPEQLFQLDPELLIANRGTDEALCRTGGLENLRACREGKVITLEDGLLADPGPRMLEAAEALREAVYGPTPAPPPSSSN